MIATTSVRLPEALASPVPGSLSAYAEAKLLRARLVEKGRHHGCQAEDRWRHGRYSVREKVVIRTRPTGIPSHSTANGSSNGATVTTLATVLARVPNPRRDGRKRVWKTCARTDALQKDGRAPR